MAKKAAAKGRAGIPLPAEVGSGTATGAQGTARPTKISPRPSDVAEYRIDAARFPAHTRCMASRNKISTVNKRKPADVLREEAPPYHGNGNGHHHKLKFIDLFCGIGGFRFAMNAACKSRGISSECVFSSDIDPDAQIAYEANFGERPTGDITKVPAKDVPDHDVLLGGFPCQAFSIIGDRKGFEDARGTLFFEIARILEAKQPAAFVLENVKQLTSHDNGRTLDRIMETLKNLKYHAQFKVLNALNFSVPQQC
jgi:hypothetical protein